LGLDRGITAEFSFVCYPLEKNRMWKKIACPSFY
jgi:hypothetical protein